MYYMNTKKESKNKNRTFKINYSEIFTEKSNNIDFKVSNISSKFSNLSDKLVKFKSLINENKE